MKGRVDITGRRKSPFVPILTGIVAFICLLALCGWTIGNDALKSLIPGESTMNPLTAITCLMEGFSVFLLASFSDVGFWRRVALTLASLVAIVVSMRLLSILFQWDWSPDRVLWRDQVESQVPSSEMSPNTAVGVLVTSLATLMSSARSKRLLDVAQVFGLATLIVGLMTAISYVLRDTQAATVYGFQAMSLPSGIVLGLLGLSVAALRPTQGILAAFAGDAASARMARRLLVTAAGVVIAINILRLLGEWAGLYDRGVSILLFSTVVVVGLTIVVGYATRLYAREESARIEAEDAARQQARFVREVVDAIPGFVFAKDIDGRFVFANAGTAAAFGKPVDDVIGKRTIDLMPDTPELQQFLESDRRVVTTGTPETFEAKSTMADGRVRWLLNNKKRLQSPFTGEPVVFGLVTDITELIEARQSAQKANEAKSEFISRMSHELRTPLNAVMGFSQLIQLSGTDQNSNESAEQITKAGRHLLDLINEILDLARIESGRLAVSLEPVIVEEALQMALGIVRPIADSRGVAIVTEGSMCDTVAMRADRQRLSQIIINLLSNAVKYNKRDGRVTVRCGESNGAVFIEVSDTGRGIPEDARHLLFEPFERLGDSETEGTGLGLSLSQRLAVAMQGTLTLASSDTSGSTFRLELPRAELERHEGARTLIEANGSTISSGEAGATVLYIEDNLANLRLIERVLEAWGPVKVISAMQGSIGLEVVRTQRPDLVLLDLHLPDMSGLDVLHEIRLDDRTSHIPVVILSADATKGQVRQATQAGADAYLTKPLDIVNLLKLLSELQANGWKRTD